MRRRAVGAGFIVSNRQVQCADAPRGCCARRYPSDDINKFLWMVRIGGGVFPDIKEKDFLGEGGYRVDDKAGKVLPLNPKPYPYYPEKTRASVRRTPGRGRLPRGRQGRHGAPLMNTGVSGLCEP